MVDDGILQISFFKSVLFVVKLLLNLKNRLTIKNGSAENNNFETEFSVEK